MQTVILTLHILVCVALIGSIMLQRSEGGALGIGGGGPGGGLMSSQGAAGALVRTTMIFAAVFFATSLVLTTMANRGRDDRSEVERAAEREALETDGDALPDPLSGPLLGEEPAPLPDPSEADPLVDLPPADDGAAPDPLAPQDPPQP